MKPFLREISIFSVCSSIGSAIDFFGPALLVGPRLPFQTLRSSCYRYISIYLHLFSRRWYHQRRECSQTRSVRNFNATHQAEAAFKIFQSLLKVCFYVSFLVHWKRREQRVCKKSKKMKKTSIFLFILFLEENEFYWEGKRQSQMSLSSDDFLFSDEVLKRQKKGKRKCVIKVFLFQPAWDRGLF